MKQNHLEARRQRYFALSTALSVLDDRSLTALFEADPLRSSWSRSHTIRIGSQRVFVKRLPLTDLEAANPFSTRNLYGLPTFYNYGVGSAGFGAYRELAANVKTTNWVLAGEIETFPLLYHYRVREASGDRELVDPERHERYVQYWAGNEAIGRFMVDRSEAKQELVLFLEYIPDVLDSKLKSMTRRTQPILGQLANTVDFLRRHGVLHFDAHFQNILVDKDRPYLTDFGLVIDRSFELSAEEIAFFKAHQYYDFGEVLSGLSYPLDRALRDAPEETRSSLNAALGIDSEMTYGQKLKALLRKSSALRQWNLAVTPQQLRVIQRYEPVISVMRDFYEALQQNARKDTPFPARALHRALNETGFVHR